MECAQGVGLLSCGEVPVAVSIMQLQDKNILAEDLVSAGRRHLQVVSVSWGEEDSEAKFPTRLF